MMSMMMVETNILFSLQFFSRSLTRSLFSAIFYSFLQLLFSLLTAHPNCILFITHGGLLSTTEAIHYGVPIIGIPVFGDQFVNVKLAVTKGFAVEVDFNYNVVSDLKAAVEKITNNSTYKERAKELSYVYHDRPTKPGVELVHWVEHVVKTRGAPHLRSPVLHAPLYQRLYLDLLATLVLATIAILLILRRLSVVCVINIISKSKKYE